MGSIHFQQEDRGSADTRQPEDVAVFHAKMIFPELFTRMKQTYEMITVRIETREIRAFEQIAVTTSESQVFKIILPAMLLRNDVLNVIRIKRLPRLSHQAVFTPVRRARPNSLLQWLGKAHQPAAWSFLRAFD